MYVDVVCYNSLLEFSPYFQHPEGSYGVSEMFYLIRVNLSLYCIYCILLSPLFENIYIYIK